MLLSFATETHIECLTYRTDGLKTGWHKIIIRHHTSSIFIFYSRRDNEPNST